MWNFCSSAELETRLRLEKAAALKQVDNRIIALKRDINKLKDVLAEYGTYEVRTLGLYPFFALDYKRHIF